MKKHDEERLGGVSLRKTRPVKIEEGRGTPIIPRRPHNRPPDGVRIAVSW